MTRTVVVTGAAGGIGTALVNRFAAAGDRVVALGRSADSLARLAQAEPVVCDVTDERSVAAAFADIGAVDLLVNNAGVGESAPLHKTTLEAWTQHLEVNATGPFLCMRAVVPGMRERGSRRDRHGGLDRRASRDPVHGGLHGLQARRDRSDPRGGSRVGGNRRARQRGLPDVRQDRDDAALDRQHRASHRAERLSRRSGRWPKARRSAACSNPTRSPTPSCISPRRRPRRSTARRWCSTAAASRPD